jgi:hypothetical protein
MISIDNPKRGLPFDFLCVIHSPPFHSLSDAGSENAGWPSISKKPGNVQAKN